MIKKRFKNIKDTKQIPLSFKKKIKFKNKFIKNKNSIKENEISFIKKKIVKYFNIKEKKLRNYIIKSSKTKNPIVNIVKCLLLRIDVLIATTNLKYTIREIRQLINHKKVKLNNIIIRNPSYNINKKCCIKLKNNKKICDANNNISQQLITKFIKKFKFNYLFNFYN